MGDAARILCVEKDREILHLLERVLLDEGYEVLAASSAAEGLSTLEESGPVHVVLAGQPAGSPGDAEFHDEVRARWPDAVRIAFAGDADAAAVASAIHNGRIYKILAGPSDAEGTRAVVENAVERFRLVQALRGVDEEVLRAVAQEVELRDAYTRGHCDRVAGYALRIAAVLGLPDESMQSLRYGSWLHDCGKIGVPEAILNRPGKLSPEELAVVRFHPAWGAEIARLAKLPPGVVDILQHHHERFEGHGYPAGMAGEEIPLAGRIVAVADAYDAVTADRPYAKRYEPEEAMRVVGVLRGAAFDPEVVDALFAGLAGEGEISP